MSRTISFWLAVGARSWLFSLPEHIKLCWTRCITTRGKMGAEDDVFHRGRRNSAVEGVMVWSHTHSSQTVSYNLMTRP